MGWVGVPAGGGSNSRGTDVQPYTLTHWTCQIRRLGSKIIWKHRGYMNDTYSCICVFSLEMWAGIVSHAVHSSKEKRTCVSKENQLLYDFANHPSIYFSLRTALYRHNFFFYRWCIKKMLESWCISKLFFGWKMNEWANQNVSAHASRIFCLNCLFHGFSFSLSQ